MAPAVRRAAPAIAAAVDGITARLRRGGRLVYIGAGTSGRLGVVDASECPPTFGVDPSLVVGIIAGGDHALRHSIEGAEDSTAEGAQAVTDLAVGPDDVLVGIAASGRTPYTLGAIQKASELGALTIAVVCNAGSPMAAAADIAIEVVAGPEFIAGSTRLKAGTAQKLVLNMLSTLTMVRLGKTYGNIMIDLRAANAKLRARSVRTVMLVTGCDATEAQAGLDAAGGSVKTAVCMILTGSDAAEAEARLQAAGGSLRAALAG